MNRAEAIEYMKATIEGVPDDAVSFIVVVNTDDQYLELMWHHERGYSERLIRAADLPYLDRKVWTA
jgi:hypothetical protein